MHAWVRVCMHVCARESDYFTCIIIAHCSGSNKYNHTDSLSLSISLLSVYEVQFYLVPLFWWSTSLSLKTVLSLNAYFNGHPWFVHYGLGTFPTRFITRWLVWRKLFNIRKYCWICEYGKCFFISEYCLVSLKTMLMVHSIA